MVLVDLVPLAKRGSYIGLFSLLWAIGTMTGPLIGAGFAQNVVSYIPSHYLAEQY